MISKKQIISDKDFGKIHFVVRRSARNITMRVKEDGLHVTTPPYRSITALLEAIAPFRERLRNVCSEVKPKPFDLNFSIEAECFRLKLETSPLKNFTVSMRDETVVIACPAYNRQSPDFSKKCCYAGDEEKSRRILASFSTVLVELV